MAPPYYRRKSVPTLRQNQKNGKSDDCNQKKVKRSSANSQADFDSVVFLVPVNNVNAMNSTVARSVDLASIGTAAPNVRSSSCPDLNSVNKIYITSANNTLLPNAFGAAGSGEKSLPLIILSKNSPLSSSPLAAESPKSAGVSWSSPKIDGASLQTNILENSPVVKQNSSAQVSPMSPKAMAANAFKMNPGLNSSPFLPSKRPQVNKPVLESSIFNENLINPSPITTVTTDPNIPSPKVPEATLEPNVQTSSFVTDSSPTIGGRGVLSEKNIPDPKVGAIRKTVTKKPQCKRPAENVAATLVFFDLETTGLGNQIGKPNVQITEITMVAMNRKEFQNSTSSELKDIRVIQKISLCTRPRSFVSSGAASITGLNNSNLADQDPFDQNVATIITSFLSHLPKPVCLLAHNGACYDYPLLKAELNRLSIHLSSDILIADTLQAVRALGVPVFPPERKIAKSVKYGSRGISYALDNLHLYFFGKKPVGGHSSEGDCIALAKVCHGMKDVMLSWIDENCFTMDTVVPMW